jgi:hypothetical protein
VGKHVSPAREDSVQPIEDGPRNLGEQARCWTRDLGCARELHEARPVPHERAVFEDEAPALVPLRLWDGREQRLCFLVFDRKDR